VFKFGRSARTTEGQRRICAIFQFEAVHEETIPSLVRALNNAGYRARLYVNARCEIDRGDIFAHFPELDFELSYVPIARKPDWQALARQAQRPDVDFICLSTFQLEGIGQWAEATGRPILGVVHNARRFLLGEVCRRLLERGQARVLTLAQHVAVYLHQRVGAQHTDHIGVLEPVYWGILPEAQAAPGPTRTVAIPGGVNFATRDYRTLLALLGDPGNRTRLGGLAFKVLGGGKDRAELERDVINHGVAEHLVFAPLGPNGRVPYGDYFAGLRDADFLYPMLPLAFHPYREHKITSAIATAVGFNLPIVLDRWTANTYRAPALVSDAPLAAAISRLIDTGPDVAAANRSAMRQYREAALDAGTAEVSRLVKLLA
jgi:hypothetical protein